MHLSYSARKNNISFYRLSIMHNDKCMVLLLSMSKTPVVLVMRFPNFVKERMMNVKNTEYCIDIYTHDMSCVQDYNATIKSHPKRGNYIQVRVQSEYKGKYLKMLKRRKIRYRYYESRWERNSTYRNDFLKASRPPYRCRYCNRYLKRDYMVVDHIVPVAKAKVSPHARFLLYIQGISNVNDIRNLAPSCQKCNRRKDTKMGLWWLRGKLGKYKLYWIMKKVLVVALIALLVYFMFSHMQDIEKILSQWLP